MTHEEPSRQDLEDAIEHADAYGSAGWTPEDFSLEFLGNLTPDQIGEHDDLSSWVELDPEDFKGLNMKEKIALLADFRGLDWAQRALGWLKRGIPPIVVIEYPDPEEGTPREEIGDGRGRVNLAIALGLKVPTWKMTHRDLLGESLSSLKKKEFLRLIQEIIIDELLINYFSFLTKNK